VGTTTILKLMREAGGDVIGLDWRVPLDEGWEAVGSDRAVQGNLDPTLLLGPRSRLLAGAADVLRRAAGRPGHIFNLGHGILPTTPVEEVQALARFVHEYRI
jgi:uroporphyrinogen decarboxylase